MIDNPDNSHADDNGAGTREALSDPSIDDIEIGLPNPFDRLTLSINGGILCVLEYLPMRDKLNLLSVNKATRAIHKDRESRNTIWASTLERFPPFTDQASIEKADTSPLDNEKRLQQRFQEYINPGKTGADKESIKQWLYLNEKHHYQNNVRIPEALLELLDYHFFGNVSKGITPFELLAALGFTSLLQQLVQQLEMDKATLKAHLLKNNGFAFCAAAAHNGHLNLLTQLWEWAGDDRQLKKSLLTVGDCHAFRAASGHLDLLKQPWEWAGDDRELKESLLTASDCFAFCFAAFNGDLDLLKQLWEWAGDDRQLKKSLLTARVGFAFRFAAFNGHLNTLKQLWEWAGNDYRELKKSLLITYDCSAFRWAAENGHLNLLKQLWEWAGDDRQLKKSLLTANGYWTGRCGVFRFAAAHGQLNLLQQLCAWAGNDGNLQQSFLRACDHIEIYHSGARHAQVKKIVKFEFAIANAKSAIDKIENHALKFTPGSQARTAAYTLVENLRLKINAYQQAPDSMEPQHTKDFIKEVHQDIKAAYPELSQHRGWKGLIGNLLLALTGIGIIAIGIKAAHSYYTQGYVRLFFKTDSAALIDEIEEDIEQLPRIIASSAA